jgi:LmbE family N-acetylglucosaminyl deacetylase
VPLRLLGVFAHPLDETLLCGGTLGRYASAGVETVVVCATQPAASSVDALRTAGRTLGIRAFIVFDFRGRELDRQMPILIDLLEDVYRSFEPHVVITLGPDGLDGHPDHVAVSHAASAAFTAVGSRAHRSASLPLRLYHVAVPRPYAAHLALALGEETAEAAASPPASTGDSPEVTTVVDVRPFLERKLAAIDVHLQALRSGGRPPLALERKWLGRELYSRVYPMPWVSGVIEGDLFSGIAAADEHPFTAARLAG